ncbi:MAG: outer membrane porin GjpA [Actinomycetia bacterium]|nr:outer membrane porin GjpA [Actinomycetes bacterium]
MSQSIRSYAAAGAAIAVAGAVAVAPAPAQALPDKALASVSPEIQLTTTADPFTVWVETFETAFANFTALTGEYFEAPLPVVQQVVANWFHYATLLPDIGDIFEDIVENANAIVENQIAAQTDNLDALHQLIYGVLEPEIPASLAPVLNYTTNYNSGMVIGALGLVVSPLLALGDQLTEFVDELVAGDLIKAANALINIPAAMTNGFLNGHGILDLTFLAGILPVPSGVTIDELGIAMGGLLSPAGSIFNSINAEVKLTGLPKITVPGVKAGLIGSWFAANQSSAEAIGWSGTGNPLAALATSSEEDAEEEEAPAELAAAATVPPSALDPESTALSVDLATDDADAESDVSDPEPSTTDSDTAETDGDADSEGNADGEGDADVDSEGDVDGEGDADVDSEGDVDGEGDADAGDSDSGDSDGDSGDSDGDSDSGDSDSGDSGDSDSGTASD